MSYSLIQDKQYNHIIPILHEGLYYHPNDYDLFKNRFSDDSEMYPIAKKIQPLLIQFKTGYRNLNIAEKSVNALKKTIQQIQKNG